jgi:hypothetical protein
VSDPTKEPQEPKKDELSIDDLNAVTGGGAIGDAITYAREVGKWVASAPTPHPDDVIVLKNPF